jgi:V-type H+-transporting ATPase subunit D
LNVAPIITMMGVVKTRLVGATKGYQLLKSDALTMQFRHMLRRIVEAKEAMGDLMKASMFSLTEAYYAAGDNVKHVVFENVGEGDHQGKSSPGNYRRCEAAEVRAGCAAHEHRPHRTS